ncbi:ABC transporter ATP-binding protein [Halorarum halophilum]|uniref:ABC-type D-xylose/L-arabinose transporter n=1 Tax=Halorarum halophilum TaxID=2743090 RepID=A0A7D5K1X9_9EURY|nr:ABC transporter ATP-binding protein [Halobaculum halophilum]QLG28321.1 ABC transporter ATP-binding protein [Halobaculum halophilum]
MSEIRIDELRKVYEVPSGNEVAVEGSTLTVPDGDFLTLLGPSGCGKSTTLRCIAGLESPTEGTVSYDEDDVTPLPAQERDISMVFQEIALYPHMRCIENIAYPLKVRGVPEDERHERAREVARILEVEELVEKHPAELSGGQRQRIAIARAIVREPRAFLMDEPMTGLDEKLKVRMRKELKRVVEETEQTVVYVTHNQEEAMMLSDWIAVMSDGVIEQYGTPDEVYNEPNNRFVAGFVGMPEMNVWRGETDGSTVSVAIGEQAVSLDLREAAGDAERKEKTSIDERSSDEVEVGFRPQAIGLVPEGEGDFDADLSLIEPMGEDSLCYLDSPVGEIRVVEDAATRFSDGDTVGVALDRHEGYVFDDVSGSTIARTGPSAAATTDDAATERRGSTSD